MNFWDFAWYWFLCELGWFGISVAFRFVVELLKH